MSDLNQNTDVGRPQSIITRVDCDLCSTAQAERANSNAKGTLGRPWDEQEHCLVQMKDYTRRSKGTISDNET